MMDRIHARRDDIYALASQNRAEKLWVFGSCARKEERPDSDVDFLVQFGSGSTLKNVVRLQRGLATVLGCAVDVVSEKCLEGDEKSVFANEVRRDMVPV